MMPDISFGRLILKEGYILADWVIQGFNISWEDPAAAILQPAIYDIKASRLGYPMHHHNPACLLRLSEVTCEAGLLLISGCLLRPAGFLWALRDLP